MYLAFVQLSERVFFFMGCDEKVGVFFRGEVGGEGGLEGRLALVSLKNYIVISNIIYSF